MQVNPGIRLLFKHQFLLLVIYVVAAQLQLLLVTALPLIGKVLAVRHPFAAGNINILLFTGINPLTFAACNVLYSQFDGGIRRPRFGVLLLDHLDLVSIDF